LAICKVDPEQSLRDSTAKFSARFRHIESAVDDKNTSLENHSAKELEDLWQRAKVETEGQ